mmetsp:Transcript_11120/g.35595  ORF Transcript_11120/g.35595 Transcript_11120/m.35595 type:complete len:261 (-) Transcript_11120:905-1687(-)
MCERWRVLRAARRVCPLVVVVVQVADRAAAAVVGVLVDAPEGARSLDVRACAMPIPVLPGGEEIGGAEVVAARVDRVVRRRVRRGQHSAKLCVGADGRACASHVAHPGLLAVERARLAEEAVTSVARAALVGRDEVVAPVALPGPAEGRDLVGHPHHARLRSGPGVLDVDLVVAVRRVHLCAGGRVTSRRGESGQEEVESLGDIIQRIGVVVLDDDDLILSVLGEGAALGFEVVRDVVAVGAEKPHHVGAELGRVLPGAG